MDKFDTLVNETLAKRQIKHKLKREIARRKRKLNNNGRVRAPNTPDHRPVSQCSPALRRGAGAGQDIADTPMPLSVGV